MYTSGAVSSIDARAWSRIPLRFAVNADFPVDVSDGLHQGHDRLVGSEVRLGRERLEIARPLRHDPLDVDVRLFDVPRDQSEVDVCELDIRPASFGTRPAM